jgi:hypothetical protein
MDLDVCVGLNHTHATVSRRPPRFVQRAVFYIETHTVSRYLE